MKHRWTYLAYVFRVIDGDSIVVNIDLGFGVWKSEQHLRLAGIDAPEWNRKVTKKKATASIEHLEGLLSAHRWGEALYIDILGKDKSGRWLAVVYLKQGTRLSVNDMMIRDGHAVEYHGGKR